MIDATIYATSIQNARSSAEDCFVQNRKSHRQEGSLGLSIIKFGILSSGLSTSEHEKCDFDSRVSKAIDMHPNKRVPTLHHERFTNLADRLGDSRRFVVPSMCVEPHDRNSSRERGAVPICS